MDKVKLWNRILVIIWALQLASELLLAICLITLGMLPAKILWIAIALIAIFAAVTSALMFTGGRDAEGVGLQRIVAGILSLFMLVVCVIASSAILRLSGTVSTISSGKETSENVSVGVYVMADDAAESLQDAKDYRFAYCTENSGKWFEQFREQAEEELGQQLHIGGYDSVTAMVDALYAGTVRAIILDEAYIDVLTDQAEYKRFEKETKRIYSLTVTLGEEQDKDAETAADITTEPFLIYLSGSDTRSKMLTTSRSDVNIIAAVNPQTKQILLLNTPRDYYVANPAGDGALDKLTHCGIYGIDCSIEALEGLYGTEIAYYAQINFTGFENLIDAIGGITVYSDISYKAVHTQIYAGENHLDGAGALDYARERHALAGGDNSRGINQMEIIKAMVEKLSASTILTKYSQILHSLEGMFIMDMSSDEISALVKMQLSDMAEWDVFTYAVTGTGGYDETYSMPGQELYVTYPNDSSVAHAADLLSRLTSGTILTDDDI